MLVPYDAGDVDGTRITSFTQRQQEHLIDVQSSISGQTPLGKLPVKLDPYIFNVSRSVKITLNTLNLHNYQIKCNNLLFKLLIPSGKLPVISPEDNEKKVRFIILSNILSTMDPSKLLVPKFKTCKALR